MKIHNTKSWILEKTGLSVTANTSDNELKITKIFVLSPKQQIWLTPDQAKILIKTLKKAIAYLEDEK